MKISKQLSGSGSITIPKDMRLHLGWKARMSLDVAATEDGAVIIRPHVNRCWFCDTLERVHRFRDVYVCRNCAETMKEEIA